MIEKLTVLEERGPAATARFVVGAEPVENQTDLDAFGDVIKLQAAERVRIPRTPDTEEHATAGSYVRWRGRQMRIESRAEARGRTVYELALGGGS